MVPSKKPGVQPQGRTAGFKFAGKREEITHRRWYRVTSRTAPARGIGAGGQRRTLPGKGTQRQ